MILSTEGAPLLIADVTHARHWRGMQDDGSGAVVTFWGEGLEKLPKKFSQAKKATPQGRAREVRFTTSEEAAVFEEALVAAFSKLHPDAARPPKYPRYPVVYRGDYMKNERVFGVETTFTTAYAAMTKKLKGDVASLVFDKERRASGIFFEQEGGGPVVVAYDGAGRRLVVARVTAGSDVEIADALGRGPPPKTKTSGRVALGDTVALFDSALAASEIARASSSSSDLAEAAARVLGHDASHALRKPGQSAPVGALLRVAPGRYEYGIARGLESAKTSYDALWLWAS